MDENKRQNLKKLRHQITGLEEQIERLEMSLQSLLNAHRTQLENYRSEAIGPYRQKALQALDSVGEHALFRDQCLQSLKALEEELEKVLSGNSQPIPHTEGQSQPKKTRRRRRGRSGHD
jgi:exonuclease VII small subunit